MRLSLITQRRCARCVRYAAVAERGAVPPSRNAWPAFERSSDMPAVSEPPPAPALELVAMLLFTVTELAGASGSGAGGRKDDEGRVAALLAAAAAVALPNEAEAGL